VDGRPVRQSTKDVPPSIGRLISVELRKMTNTRSGFWVAIGVAAMALLVGIVASVNHHGHETTFPYVLHAVVAWCAYLLPVMGILLICGEWSQRTKLTTFTLVPSRRRVLTAKLGASWIVSTIALMVCLLVTMLSATILGHHPGGAGSLSWQLIGQSWIYLAATMVVGLAFGSALLVSAPAIVTYLLLPLVWSVLSNNISALSGVSHWLDSSQTFGPLPHEVLSATQWAHAAVTFAVWAGIPLLIGARRIGRGDLD
jgi:hypothetical protein